MHKKLAIGCLSLVLSLACGCSPQNDLEIPQDEIALTEQLAASDSVPSILDANIRASGGMDAWSKLTGVAMEAVKTVSINGQVTVQTREKIEIDLSGSRWRVTSFSGDLVERFTVGTLS